MTAAEAQPVVVHGARQNNLQGISLSIPANRLVVFTGVSGSGKSSLAFDTVYEESRTRYLEILLPNAFRKVTLRRPAVEYIEGLRPALAIHQKTSANLNPRSTVGTSTEVLTFLRILFARFACSDRGAGGDVNPALFSFNTPDGMCERCGGLGAVKEFSADFVLPDRSLGLGEILKRSIPGTFKPLEKSVEGLARALGFSLDTPFGRLPRRIQQIVLDGYDREIQVDYVFKTSVSYRLKKYPGLIPFLEESYRDTTSEERRKRIENYMSFSVCPECQGRRLNAFALSYRLDGRNIHEVCRVPVGELIPRLEKMALPRGGESAREVLREVLGRLTPIREVGLGYLDLARATPTLSVGESQRLLLAHQLGAGLSGLLYVLDEPTIGLHEAEKESLVATLKRLRDLGNSVFVVEHDERVIRSADYVVELGPGAGRLGGRVVAAGRPEAIARDADSLTGRYLRSGLAVRAEAPCRPGAGWIEILGAAANNLRSIDVRIPLGLMVCVTGPSGSGKSTLVQQILVPALERKLSGARVEVGRHTRIRGLEHVRRVVNVDQAPIGRSPRSHPASYVGIWDAVRSLYAELPETRAKQLQKGAFSFNTDDGACPSCQGAGSVPMDQFLLPELELSCPECQGRRYQKHILEIRYQGRNISDVLELTFEEALGFFAGRPEITRVVETVRALGLGYLKLGQPATTLSGGEAQRLKLVFELKRRASPGTLFVLDEPTTGLHAADVEKLLEIVRLLLGQGASVLVIEHNLDVIRAADYLIDLGPGGGIHGGNVVAFGSPREVADHPSSPTGRYLRQA